MDQSRPPSSKLDSFGTLANAKIRVFVGLDLRYGCILHGLVFDWLGDGGKLRPVLKVADELAVLVHFVVVCFLGNVEEFAQEVLVPVGEDVGKPEPAHQLDGAAKVGRETLDGHAHVRPLQCGHGPDLACDKLVAVAFDSIEHRAHVPEPLGHNIGPDGRVGQLNVEVANDARLLQRAVDDAKVVGALARRDGKG